MTSGTDHSWARRAPARLARSLIQRLVLLPVLAFVNPVRVSGRERLRGVGAAVFIANHQSHLDTPICLKAVGPRVRKRLVVAAAADYFYRSRLVGLVVSLALGTVPFVRRDGSSRESLDRLKELLRSGWSVLLFPSGTRGEDWTLRPGFAYLAVDAEVPVVPLLLLGPEHAMPKGSRLPLPGGVSVKVGEPIPPGISYDALVERATAALEGLRAAG